MRVFVLGETRFAGPAAVVRLLEHGHNVAMRRTVECERANPPVTIDPARFV